MSYYPLTDTEEDERLVPSALVATTVTVVGPRPTARLTDQVPLDSMRTGEPLTVTFAPGDAVPEICTFPVPLETVETMLTFDPI